MTQMPQAAAFLGRAAPDRRPVHAREAIGRPPIASPAGPQPDMAATAAAAAADRAAGAAELAAHLTDPRRPLLMFGQQRCEFSRSVRHLFQAIGAPLHGVDLDDPNLQAGGRAQALRAALVARCGAPTLPQVYIGGQRLGGCTATLDAWNAGHLAARLRAAGVPFRADTGLDARSLIPAWAQPF
jgi:cysteine synthase A